MTKKAFALLSFFLINGLSAEMPFLRTTPRDSGHLVNFGTFPALEVFCGNLTETEAARKCVEPEPQGLVESYEIL